MNHDCDNAYHTVQWHIDAAKNEVVVLHALRVLPDYGGRGYSKQLVEHAIQTAKSCPSLFWCGKQFRQYVVTYWHIV